MILWIARSLMTGLMMFEKKPRKINGEWVVGSGVVYATDNDLFPEVKHTDKEPKRIKLELIDNE